jgi:glyoxylase-like metal-dependent hydrolase (beta-lactamase superfamily II)
MRYRNLIPAIAIGASCGLAQLGYTQGFGTGEGLPRHEITHLTGDLYRFRHVRHFGMFLVTPDGIVVVDPTNSEAAAWLKDQLDQRFGLPVKYVIYSHSHNDHASGGEVFAETATFIGHENMRKNLQSPAADAPLLMRERLWDTNGDGVIRAAEAEGTVLAGEFTEVDTNRDGALTSAEIWARRFGGEQVPPDIYYAHRASITLGGKTVELHYTGRNHTDDMTVVLFPEERTIYTVDFLTPKRPPRTTLYGGFFPDWVDSLRQVEQLDFDTISPGHELPGTKADVIEQRRYLEDLVAAVSAGIAEGKTKQQLVETVLMEDYDHLIEYDESRAGNVVGVYETLMSKRATRAPVSSRYVPTFRVDPDWPRLPAQWRLGDVSSIAIDAQDNAWLLHRPRTLSADEAPMAAPPVVGFDNEGNFLDAWGGAGDGYEWPQREHGLHIDYRGFVWLGGNNCPARNIAGLEPASDDQLLKFTPQGELVMQLGRSNASRGNADTENLHEPADAVVHPPTNELFVADGYGNHRVAVFDADSGVFKRMWGAFGNVPQDDDHCPNLTVDSVPEGPGPPQFSVVHAIRVSTNGSVYVADRENRRVQVFTLDGEYLDQIVWGEAPFARNLALSPDPEQQFLYVGGGNGIRVYDRRTLEFLTTIEGEGVVGAGHQIQTDSHGNLYIAATGSGYQRLVFTGLSLATAD